MDIWLNADYLFIPGDVFIAPLFDAGRILRALSGFSGSFGAMILVKDGGGFFFTDGRYLLQAEAEVGKNFEVLDIRQLGTWLNDHQDRSFVFDSRLQTRHWHSFFKNVNHKAADLDQLDAFYEEFLSKNSYDGLNIYNYDECYAGRSALQKIDDFFQNVDCDHFLMLDPANVSWMLNIRSDNIDYNQNASCCALFSRAGRVKLFLNSHDIAISDLTIEGVECVDMSFMKQNLKESSLKTISLDKDKSTHYFANLLQELEIEAEYVESNVGLTRAVKTKREIENFRQIHLRDGLALTRFLLWLGENLPVSEYNAAQKLLEFRKQDENFVRESFATISAFGEHGAIIHYQPSAEKSSLITDDNLYLLDSGGHYLGGTTDATRTMHFGEPSGVQKFHYTLVLKGNIALQKAIFPRGTTGGNLDILARYKLWQQGLDYPHSTGHGVGNFLHVHEIPSRIALNDKTILQKGMILSNEPGLYLPGKYGIRLENMMLVTAKNENFLQFECLTLTPFAINLIDCNLLDETEREWILNYNQHVFEKLSPSLDEREKIIYQQKFLSR